MERVEDKNIEGFLEELSKLTRKYEIVIGGCGCCGCCGSPFIDVLETKEMGEDFKYRWGEPCNGGSDLAWSSVEEHERHKEFMNQWEKEIRDKKTI